MPRRTRLHVRRRSARMEEALVTRRRRPTSTFASSTSNLRRRDRISPFFDASRWPAARRVFATRLWIVCQPYRVTADSCGSVPDRRASRAAAEHAIALLRSSPSAGGHLKWGRGGDLGRFRGLDPRLLTEPPQSISCIRPIGRDRMQFYSIELASSYCCWARGRGVAARAPRSATDTTHLISRATSAAGVRAYVRESRFMYTSTQSSPRRAARVL